jgi:hypothetical protein
VALFVEMYGFPLTIYLLSGWLVRRYRALIFSRMMLAIYGTRCLAGKSTRISTPAYSQ